MAKGRSVDRSIGRSVGGAAQPRRLTGKGPLLVPAAPGERAVRTALFYFHDASADGFGEHRVMLCSSQDRKTDGRVDRKTQVSDGRADRLATNAHLEPYHMSTVKGIRLLHPATSRLGAFAGICR